MDVVYEDDWLVVVDKPHGLPTQPPRDSTDSVLTRLKTQYRYVGLHHRLDTPASGLLVLAVHPDANPGLAETFRTHSAERTYVAVVAGTCTAPEEWRQPVDGRPAHTRMEPRGTAEGRTACILRPTTGRKHQLRIHCALAGTPILGDRRHGGEVGRWWPRLALHAGQLALPHPRDGHRLTLQSPLPPDLVELWRAIGIDRPA